MNSVVKHFVQQLYRNTLLRDGEAEGIAHWAGLAGNGLTSVEMVKGFITSSEAQSVTAVLRLYQIFFGRAADIDGLRHWVNSLHNGSSLDDIASAFSRSEEFKQQYPNAAAGDVVERFYNNLFARASDADGKSHWLNLVERGGWTLSEVAAAFTTSSEATAPQGLATRFAESYLALRSSNGATPSTESVKALAGHPLLQVIAELQTVNGTVLAGTIEQAHVYRSVDQVKPDTLSLRPVEGDASGRFALTGGYGSLYAAGGRDITTGAANNRWLSTVVEANSGEIVITPLTTLVHALSRQGVGIADAVSLVNRAFGIDFGVDLLSFHHLDKATANTSSAADKKNALIIKGVIAQLSILTEGAAILLKGMPGNGGVDTRMVSLLVAEALGDTIANASARGKPYQAGALLGLDTLDVVSQLMADCLRRFEATDLGPLRIAAANRPDGLAADAAKIITTFNTPISKTVQFTGTLSVLESSNLIDAISLIAKTEGFAISELQALIGTGMQDGSLSDEAALLMNRDLAAAVRAFVIGKISNGVESTNAGAIIDRIFNAMPPAGQGDATPPPNFHVINTLGKITFSGSATGNITLAIDADNEVSFSRGGITAATKGSALSTVIIELSAHQSLELTKSQLAQLVNFTVKGSGNLIIQGAMAIATLNDIQFDGFSGGFSYRIQDTPANILNTAAATLSSAQEVTVIAGSNVFYSAAVATELLSRLTNRAGLTLGVVDTAAALLTNHAIAGVTAYKLSADANDLSVANAAALVGISGFNADGKNITVQDTAAAILANHSITGVSVYKLSENADNLSVANAATLAGIGGGNGFSANGKTITVQDTAAAILANHSIAGVSIYRLSENADNFTVANATILAGINDFEANGKQFTVRDTAAAILASHAIEGVTAYKVIDTHTAILSQHAGMPYVTAFLLSADAVDMSVADASALSAVSGFGVNGHVFSVKDTFNAIRANHAIPGVTKYQLDSNTSVENIQLLQSEGLALANLRYVIADLASAIAAADTSLLNGADAMFISASSGNDNIDLNRGGAVTVRVSIDLGAGDDNILSSEGDDHINGNVGADTMDGGAGRDFYIYSDKGTDSLVSSGSAAAAGFDVVNTRGGDGFYIAAFSAVRTVLNIVNPVSGSGTDLLAALDATYASVKVANNDVMFARFLDGSQYLVINDGQDGNTGINGSDTVIKIIGSGLPAVAAFNLLLFNAQ